MSLLRYFVAKIDLLKFQRPLSSVSKHVSSRFGGYCVTYRHHHVRCSSRLAPCTFSLHQAVLNLNLNSLLEQTPVGRRCCSSSASSAQSALKTWEYRLDPFGKLILNSTSMNCIVSPIDPNEYPEQDLVVVAFHGSEGEDAISCEQLGDDVHVSQVDGAEGASLDIKVPIKYGVAANFLGQANLDISMLENENINVNMDCGTCTLTNMKSGTIKISSTSGDIVSKKSLQGNATFRTAKDGSITLNKLVCNDLSLETESGDIKVTSLYAAKSYFNTLRGNVNIGSCHKETMVNMQHIGNLNVGTLDGSLLASVGHGDVDVHITQHNSVQVLVTKGNINLKMANPEETLVELRANDVQIADDLGPRNVTQQGKHEQCFVTGSLGIPRPPSIVDTSPATIVASTGDGNIAISQQDWMDTLKLKYKQASD